MELISVEELVEDDASCGQTVIRIVLVVSVAELTSLCPLCISIAQPGNQSPAAELFSSSLRLVVPVTLALLPPIAHALPESDSPKAFPTVTVFAVSSFAVILPKFLAPAVVSSKKMA